jgi:hypothetical protein
MKPRAPRSTDMKRKARLTYRTLKEKEKRPLLDHPQQGLLFPGFVSQ